MALATWPHSFFYIPGRTYDPTAALNTPTGIGTTYYVDGAIGASGDGLTLLTAKKTINEGIALLDQPGDRLLIKGGLYLTNNDIVSCNVTGATQTDPFIIGPYNGEEVVIDPSVQVTNWSVYDAPRNIYVADVTGLFPVGKYPETVVINYYYHWQEADRDGMTGLDTLLSNPGVMSDGSVVPTNKRWWYDYTNKLLYVRTDQGNPGEQDTGVLYFSSTGGKVGLSVSESYYRIYGITTRFAPYFGLASGKAGERLSYVNFEWCRSLFNSAHGIVCGNNDYSHISKCLSYRNVMQHMPFGRYSISGGWGASLVLSACTYSEIEGSISYLNAGEGISLNGYLGDSFNKMYNNIAYGNHGTNGYVDSEGECDVYGNLQIGRKPVHAECYNIQQIYNDQHPAGPLFTSQDYDRFLVEQRPQGINGADEHDTYDYRNVRYYNNIIIKCRGAYGYYAPEDCDEGALHGIAIQFNTIILPAESDLAEIEKDFGRTGGIGFKANVNGTHSDVYIQNNIIYHQGYDYNLLLTHYNSYNPPGPDSLFAGITINYNLLYQTTPAQYVYWWFYDGEGNPHLFTHEGWLGRHDDSGTHGVGDVTTEPQFAGGSPPASFDPNDYALEDGSPAIAAGTAPPFTIAYDFWGNPRGSRYDIGALHFTPGPSGGSSDAGHIL